MNKKIFFLAFPIVFLLAGCSTTTKPIDMSYDQAYQIFFDNITNSELVKLATLIEHENTTEEMLMTITTDNEQVSMDIDIAMQGQSNRSSMNAESLIQIDMSILDKQENQPLSVSGELNLRMIDQNIFVKLNTLILDMGPGKAEASLIQMIVDNFKNKRIQLDYEDMPMIANQLKPKDMMTIAQIPQYLTELLQKYPIFTASEVTTYNGMMAYRINKNTAMLQSFLNELQTKLTIGQLSTDINAEQIELEGYLVIKSEDTVTLILEKLYFPGAMPITIDWEIEGEYVDLSITNDVLISKLGIALQRKRKALVMDLTMIQPNQPTLVANFVFAPQKIDNGLCLDFNSVMEIQIPALALADSSAWENMVFDINGQYTIQKTDEVTVKTPSEYILLSQLFGDPYAMSAILEGTGTEPITELKVNIPTTE